MEGCGGWRPNRQTVRRAPALPGRDPPPSPPRLTRKQRADGAIRRPFLQSRATGCRDRTGSSPSSPVIPASRRNSPLRHRSLDPFSHPLAAAPSSRKRTSMTATSARRPSRAAGRIDGSAGHPFPHRRTALTDGRREDGRHVHAPRPVVTPGPAGNSPARTPPATRNPAQIRHVPAATFLHEPIWLISPDAVLTRSPKENSTHLSRLHPKTHAAPSPRTAPTPATAGQRPVQSSP
jgi:hypothetical protein